MFAKSFALTGIGNTLHQGLTQHRCTAHRAGQAGVIGHFNNGRNATFCLTDHDAPSVFKFNFGTGITAVADFFFQSLHMNIVLGAIF
ncbi:hypothetical protein SDC9_208324 [bioreactor metagenome]|uniref:Uncharacterized protein n=1 Tax=bioreactor metagenome TaxID=1076179 RepID=A0A645JA99_9ZZZZ